MLIVTNNPMVKENDSCGKEILFIEGTYSDILKECRDLIHKGYELLSHPLYSSVKPNETPYRTIILKDSAVADNNSIILIEEAINTSTKFQNDKMTPNWTKRVLEDFQVIDYDIFNNTIQRIQY